jgi:hypothetical protein
VKRSGTLGKKINNLASPTGAKEDLNGQEHQFSKHSSRFSAPVQQSLSFLPSTIQGCPLAPDNLKRPGTEAPARGLSSRLNQVERQPPHSLYPLQQMVALQFCHGQSGATGISRPACSAQCSLLLGIIPTEDHRDRRRPGRAFGMRQIRIRALDSGSGSCAKISLPQNPVRQTKDLARRKEVERQLIHSFLTPISPDFPVPDFPRSEASRRSGSLSLLRP